MYFDPFDEYPHEVSILTEQSVSNGLGGTKKEWKQLSTMDGFMDTPSSKRRIEAQQMNIVVDRDLYFEYGQTIPKGARIEFEGVQYIASGDADDQGGMHEKMLLPLKRA